VVAAARDAGLLTAAAGDNVVRLLPALIVTEAEIDEAMTRLDAAFAMLDQRPRTAATG
jgi:acetylornithine/N-succinyldiaminopimelate aminotransferase